MKFFSLNREKLENKKKEIKIRIIVSLIINNNILIFAQS